MGWCGGGLYGEVCFSDGAAAAELYAVDKAGMWWLGWCVDGGVFGEGVGAEMLVG